VVEALGNTITPNDAVRLFVKIVRAMEPYDIEVNTNIGLDWIIKTNACYTSISINNFMQEIILSVDNIRWLISHVKELMFNAHRFDEVTSESLCEGICQEDSVVTDLRLHFDDEPRQVRATKCALQSLTSMFQQQTRCSLTSLHIDILDQDAQDKSNFFEALAQYRGSIKCVGFVMRGRDDAEYAKCVGWYEMLMTSSIINDFHFSALRYLSDDEVAEGTHRLLTAIKQNENIEDVDWDEGYDADVFPTDTFTAAVSSILGYRKIKKKLNLIASSMLDTESSTHQYLNNLAAMLLLSNVRLLNDHSILYTTVHSHPDVYLHMWKFGEQTAR